MNTKGSINDLLTRIRNGQSRYLLRVQAPLSKINASILNVLYREGYICGYRVDRQDKVLTIFLKYTQGKPAIYEIKRISKSSKRVYSSINTLWKLNSLDTYILSTSCGILSSTEARIKHIGGELICSVR